MNGYIVLLTDDQSPWVMSNEIRIRSTFPSRIADSGTLFLHNET